MQQLIFQSKLIMQMVINLLNFWSSSVKMFYMTKKCSTWPISSRYTYSHNLLAQDSPPKKHRQINIWRSLPSHFVKHLALKDVAEFTGKHLKLSSFSRKVAKFHCSCFSMNFAKIFRNCFHWMAISKTIFHKTIKLYFKTIIHPSKHLVLPLTFFMH